MRWLEKEPVYTLHKPARKNYTLQATKVFGVDKQWQADLVDMQKFRRYNSGFGYLLCVIDVFSKFAFVIPIKKKNGSRVVAGLKKITKQRSP